MRPGRQVHAGIIALAATFGCGDGGDDSGDPVAAPCASDPCLHGGRCSDTGMAFVCACAPGWSGATCEIAVPCDVARCGVGTCRDLGAGEQACDCPAGYFDDGSTCASCGPLAGCERVSCTSDRDASCRACASGFELVDGACRERRCPPGTFEDGGECGACPRVAGCDAWTCTGANDSRCEECSPGLEPDGLGGCRPMGCAPGFEQMDDGGCREVVGCDPNPCPYGACRDEPGGHACTAAIEVAQGGEAVVETAIGPVMVTAEADAFVDAAGTLVTGDIFLIVDPATFDGGFEDDRGEAFEPLAMTHVALVDASGEAARVAQDAAVSLTLPLPADTLWQDGDRLALHRFAADLGRWRRVSEGTVRVHASGLGLRAALGPAGWYAAGTTCEPMPGCVRLSCATGLCAACAGGFERTSEGGCADVDDCAGHACGPGTCRDGAGGYTCDCPAGTWGDGATRCSPCAASDVAECTAVTCTGPETSTCTVCATGFGLVDGRCVAIHDCAGRPCGPGTCTDVGPNAWVCDCPAGTFGDGTPGCAACPPSPVTGCTAVTCDAAGTSTCTACAVGYTLSAGRCLDIDDCADVPCGPGGRCVDALAGHHCDCPDGMFGDGATRCSTCDPIAGCDSVTCTGPSDERCAVCAVGFDDDGAGGCRDHDDCLPDPCQGGACTDTGIGSYACDDCPAGGYDDGHTCTPCRAVADCMVVRCTSAIDATCVACATGFAPDGGGGCAVPPDPCTPDPCHGGTCSDEGEGVFACSDCPDGTFHDGETCADCDAIVACAEVTCAGAGASTCETCDWGHDPDLGGACRDHDDCAPNPCHGGTCTDTGVESFRCSCPSGLGGVDCSVEVSSCESSFECPASAAACVGGECRAIDNCAVDDARDDADDGPNGAGALVDGATHGMTCAAPGEADWFVFELGGGDRQRVVTLSWDDEAFDLDLEIHDASGALLGSSAGVVDPEEVTLVEPAAGRYYAVVLPYAGGAGVSVAYTIGLGGCAIGAFADQGGCSECTPLEGCEVVACEGPGSARCMRCAPGFDADGSGGCVDHDDCEPDPCHGGACTDLGVDDYACRCPVGYSGHDCESVASWCDTDLECPAASPACVGNTCGVVDACDADDPREHGDDGPAGALPFTSATSPVTGAICGAPGGASELERDWFIVTLEGDPARALCLAWETPEVDLDLYVLDAAGLVVGAAAGVSSPEGLELETGLAGDFFVVVQAYDGAPSRAVAYTLTLGACP